MGELEPFIDAGLYNPDAPNAAERREYLEFLLGRGHSVADIINAAQDGNPDVLFHIAWDLRAPSPPRMSAVEIAERCGGSLDDLLEMRALFGVPVKDPEAPEIPETFVADFNLFLMACGLWGRDNTLGYARTIGAAVTMLTEGGRELVLTPLRTRNATETDIAVSNEFAMGAWQAMRDVVSNLMREQPGRADWFSENLLRGEFTMGVAFVDLVDSTDWTTSVGEASHRQALSRFEHEAARLAAKHDSRVVKFIGDEAMVVGHDAAAVATVVACLCAFVAADDVLPGTRAAVGFGEVTPRGGDYFGDLVNLVARATKAAPVDGIVATESVVTCLVPSQWCISAPRAVSLRGVGDVELYDISALDA
ncbi:MAG: adenylate cyclase [Actinomycetota bacterium]